MCDKIQLTIFNLFEQNFPFVEFQQKYICCLRVRRVIIDYISDSFKNN